MYYYVSETENYMVPTKILYGAEKNCVLFSLGNRPCVCNAKLTESIKEAYMASGLHGVRPTWHPAYMHGVSEAF